MERLEYLVTFVSILIALGLTDILYSVHRLLRKRQEIKWNWLPLAWAFILFMFLINTWYALGYITETILIQTAAGFVLWISPILMTLLGCLAVLPDKEPEKGFDLKEWYFGQQKYFFLIMSCMVLFLIISQSFTISIKYLIPHIVILLLSISMIFIKKYLYHAIITVMMVLIFTGLLMAQAIEI